MRYSHRFYHFSVIVLTVFSYSYGFDLFPVLARILQFCGSHTDSTILGKLFGQFFGTRSDSTFSRYSHGFYNFAVLTMILPFFNTRRNVFHSLHGFYLCQCSPEFYHFALLTLILQFFGIRTDSFLALARILRFPGTRPDSSIFGTQADSTTFRYSSGQFFRTRTDSTFSRYSLKFYNFAVHKLILPYLGNRSESFSVLARILPFPDTRMDSTILRYSH